MAILPLAGIGSVDTRALEKLEAHDTSDFSGCKLAKFSTLPFSNIISSSTAPFDIVQFDVWGPSPVSIKGDSKYYVSFIDDFTRYTWIYLVIRRFDFLTVFKEFRALIKTHHSIVVKCFLCDLGGEYTSNEFVGLLKSVGTISLPFVLSALRIADVFTKPHSGPRFCFLTDKL
ncbi:gag-pol polyprotein [Tanacetum coccineum]